MPETSVDLSGQWDGEFSYPAGEGPVTPFVATLVQRGNSVTGNISEPDLHLPGATAEATFVGVVTGEAVDFTKTYRKVVWGYVHPVDYVGQIREKGNVIAGVWSLLDMNGRFEMRRHATRELAEEREAEIEIER
ncbi:hypothetical protein [Aurantiacibacter gilvus]|uniref:Uncharacterized protein n=1 Tax=Aurantiacibacter gilvus TaxID=3139141 RepID=A0ABU9IAZ6_9SPHN